MVIDDLPVDSGNVLTVAELNARISEVIGDADSLQGVQCVGEVSQVNEYDWGVFIDLVDGDYELTALMWGSRYRKLESPLEPGMEVLLTGSVDFYAEDARISLKPWEVYVVGDGERALRLTQLRSELAERGWFEETHKQPLPTLPRRIGIVTSLDGDARYDIETSIHDRYPDVELLIRDARVQGEHAPTSIANAIHTLDRETDVDVIIVGRGGGSETDLDAFNSEAVAEAIFTAGTPIVTAVGHREDEPLAGEVADATAITPTEAGTVVVPDRKELTAHLERLNDRLERAYTRSVQAQLDELHDRLETTYTQTVRDELDRLEDRLEAAFAEQQRRHAQRTTRRKYGAIIAVLLAIVLGLVLYIAFTGL